MQGNPGKQNKILCSDDKVLHSFHRVFNIQLLFCTPAVERKAAPALSTSLSHCIHNPVENHGAAPFHTFSDFYIFPSPYYEYYNKFNIDLKVLSLFYGRKNLKT